MSAPDQEVGPIPITKPWFDAREHEALKAPLESGWVVQGPEVAAFEAAFAEATGAAHAAATTSCTTALHLAVAALGAGPGDEVIVPAFTWVATPNVVEYVGARPVFVDVDPVSFNVTAKTIEAAITERTVGVMPVHLFGLCAPMEGIMEVARANDLWVVEDAACGYGAMVGARHAGTFGAAGCFSFHPRKSITTGEGGMVLTDDATLDAHMRSLRDHGATTSDHARHGAKGGFLLPEFPHVGFNYRMTDLQGALGRIQLDKGPEILARRRALAARYDRLLADTADLRTPAVPRGMTHGYQAYVCSLPAGPTGTDVDAVHARRNAIMGALEQLGIATRPGTHAAALQGAYVERYATCRDQFPHADAAERTSIALPLYPQMTEAEQDRVVDALKLALEGAA